MSNIPQDLIDTGLRWTKTANAGQYCACDGDDMLTCHTHDRVRSVGILRYHDIGWTRADATRPTVAEALAVARRMIEVAQ